MGTRPKAFIGTEKRVPLDREAKVRIQALARARHHAKRITDDAWFLVMALLWTFHNAKTGACYPSRKRLAQEVACSERNVARVIARLELLKMISWTRCLKRDRNGASITAANGYVLIDPVGQFGPRTTLTTFFDLKRSAAEAARAIDEEKKRARARIWSQWAAGELAYDDAKAEADAIDHATFF
jgi:hypothetical protein